jgi:hypothetical protein
MRSADGVAEYSTGEIKTLSNIRFGAQKITLHLYELDVYL